MFDSSTEPTCFATGAMHVFTPTWVPSPEAAFTRLWDQLVREDLRPIFEADTAAAVGLAVRTRMPTILARAHAIHLLQMPSGPEESGVWESMAANYAGPSFASRVPVALDDFKRAERVLDRLKASPLAPAELQPLMRAWGLMIAHMVGVLALAATQHGGVRPSEAGDATLRAFVADAPRDAWVALRSIEITRERALEEDTIPFRSTAPDDDTDEAFLMAEEAGLAAG